MSKKKYLFATAHELEVLIARYFDQPEGPGNGAPPVKTVKTKTAEKKGAVQKPQSPTVAGLALALGFNSRLALEDYEAKGRFAPLLKRARLRIEELYEKKLHTQYTSGAIFALKSLGWNERTDTVETGNIKLKIQIVQTGPKLASSEKEVVLE